MDIEFFAELITMTWLAAATFLGIFAYFNVPLLALFAAYRRSQLTDHTFEVRVTTPAHTSIHTFCAWMYGFLMPAFYFLGARTRHELGPWILGPETNTLWTISLGALCMTWLAVHLIEAALRLGRPRFELGWVDRIFAGMGLLLCLRYHFKVAPWLLGSSPDLGNAPFSSVVMQFIYPQSCFLGATLVYGFAFWESIRLDPAPLAFKRRWAIASGLALALGAFLFAPFWLSIPRVTRTEALGLIESHRDGIVETARLANLDPKLLAGIVYVAHTRDHPRIIGEPLERLGVRLWSQKFAGVGVGHPALDEPFVNASAGLMQMRPSTAVETLLLAELYPWVDSAQLHDARGGAITGIPWSLRMPGGKTPFMRALLELENKEATFDPSVPAGLLHPLLEPMRAKAMDRLLLEPEHNLALAVTMLVLIRDQWEHLGFPIDDRPEILATLYNLGYRRSRPHGEPKANDFGRRVAEFMQTREALELFPTTSGGETDER